MRLMIDYNVHLALEIKLNVIDEGKIGTLERRIERLEKMLEVKDIQIEKLSERCERLENSLNEFKTKQQNITFMECSWRGVKINNYKTKHITDKQDLSYGKNIYLCQRCQQ